MNNELDFRDFERDCVCQTLRRVARRLSRRYEDALRPIGLKAGQFTILASLRRPEPVSVSELAEQLGMDRTTLTRDLAPLERRGLVAIAPSETDARVRAITLTRKGRALLAEAVPLWRAAQKESRRRLDGVRWSRLRDELDRLAG